MGNGLEPVFLAKRKVLLHGRHRESINWSVYHREIRLGNLGKPLIRILVHGKRQPESPDTELILHKPRPGLGRNGPSRHPTQEQNQKRTKKPVLHNGEITSLFWVRGARDRILGSHICHPSA